MTKKHYEAIAKILKRNKASYPLVDNLSDYFEQDNPRFQRDRFLEACGVEVETKNIGATLCPQCHKPVWDVAKGSKLNKCHECNLAFDIPYNPF